MSGVVFAFASPPPPHLRPHISVLASPSSHLSGLSNNQHMLNNIERSPLWYHLKCPNHLWKAIVLQWVSRNDPSPKGAVSSVVRRRQDASYRISSSTAPRHHSQQTSNVIAAMFLESIVSSGMETANVNRNWIVHTARHATALSRMRLARARLRLAAAAAVASRQVEADKGQRACGKPHPQPTTRIDLCSLPKPRKTRMANN